MDNTDIPQVKWEYLTESSTHTGCPYKGEASYYHAVVNGAKYEDVVWWYKSPLLESAQIQGMLCFYPDKVDMWIDGKKKEKEIDNFSGTRKEIEEPQQANKAHSSGCSC